MSYNTTNPKKSSQALHDQYVTSVAKLFTDSGWSVLFDTVGITPSGSRVRADLKTLDPQGEQFVFEFKMGKSEDYLPMSAYAQGAQLNRSGTPAVVVTNMQVPDSLAELFRESQIPVVKIPERFDQKAFWDSFRAAVAETLTGGRNRF